MEEGVNKKLIKALWSNLFDELDSLHDEIKSKLKKEQPVYIGSSGDYPNIEKSEK
jgi:hypothetical protein